jgi:hypothetical protein
MGTDPEIFIDIYSEENANRTVSITREHVGMKLTDAGLYGSRRTDMGWVSTCDSLADFRGLTLSRLGVVVDKYCVGC